MVASKVMARVDILIGDDTVPGKNNGHDNSGNGSSTGSAGRCPGREKTRVSTAVEIACSRINLATSILLRQWYQILGLM